jgi:hypothetical protein
MVERTDIRLLSAFRYLTAVTLLLCVALFLIRTLRWPILGDASLMHYVVFLMDRGAAPYRDIAEMNMPGSYLVEWSAIHLLGGGQLAWRLFDFGLVAAAIAAMVVVTRPLDWLAGFWAGSLFLLLHGRDGLLELGQRDLTLAVFLLAAYAFLLGSLRSGHPSLLLLFGLLAGLAGTIKPTMIPVGPLSLIVVYVQLTRLQKPRARFLLCGVAGLLASWLGVLYFLWRKNSLEAFRTETISMLVYHARLARQPVGYLLLHSFSPLLPLVLAWFALVALRRKQVTWEGVYLWIALGFGLLSYLSQAKGYSYQRYPFLAFLLLIMSIDLVAALREKGVARVLAITGLAFGAFFLGPISTAMAGRYDWRDLGTVGMLEEDLTNLGQAQLSGGVQCVDSVSGCTNVLYRMKLTEPSAVFYDEFLFGPESVPAIRENRQKFLRDLQRNPPAVVVVTDRLFPQGSGHYEKLSLWPQFDAYLSQRYFIYLQRKPERAVRWWSRPEIPAGYRIYLRNPQIGAESNSVVNR